jgi:nucleoside-diphosphate-sugar epimerase
MMSISKVLITGANGFVGSALVRHFDGREDMVVRAACRSTAAIPGSIVRVPDLGPNTDWRRALDGIDVVIHCAARVHMMKERAYNPLDEFRLVNVEGTRNLATQALASGVRRLVFISSIKVNGESTTGMPPFSHWSPPTPEDAYGMSKWEAEQELWRIAEKTGLEVVVVRPPLIYGPGVRANFQRLMQAVRRGIPLPFGAVNNARSMVYVGNLVSLLDRCATHPAAASQTFLTSDGQDLSTGELIMQLAFAMRRQPRLIAIPPSWMRGAATLLGKKDLADRLLGSLQVDATYTCKMLGWAPPFTVEQGMLATVVASP